MEEDGTFRITSEQLLAKASDVDGDELSVLNLKVAEGQGAITDNKDGTWTFKPTADWNGEVSFEYGVTDNNKQVEKINTGPEDLISRSYSAARNGQSARICGD